MTPKDVKRVYLQIREKLLEYENVIGVGIGNKEKNGKIINQLAIIVLVIKKIPASQLHKKQLIPDNVQGIPIDVREARILEKDHLDFLKNNGITVEEGECNLDHFFLSDKKIHEISLRRLNEERKPKNEPRDPATAVYGEIFVIEDDGTLISGSNIDHVGAYNIFRSHFGDHYDFVFFHYDTASGVPSQGNSSPTIYNDIIGLNHYQGDSYNQRPTWSSSKIQSIQKISDLTQVRRMLHETAHRWCAYVYHREVGIFSDNLHKDFSSPSQAIFHWGTWFDNDNSCMDYDYYNWINSTIHPGEFEKIVLAYGVPGSDQFGYHPLDLYLMGLASGSEVQGQESSPGTFRYIQNPLDPDSDGSYNGTQVNLTIANVINEEGVRSPSYPNTQRVFHQAFILITNNLGGIGSIVDSSTVLGNFELYRKGFLDAFKKNTLSRAMIDGSLLHSNFDKIYIRDNISDVGNSSSTGAFWNSPDMWIRNNDDGGTTHQDTIRGMTNYIHARIWNNSGINYDDVIVRFYRANFTGTEFYYPDDWHHDQLIGESTINIPTSGSAIAKVPWESHLIPDELWHPCILLEVIPMEVTPENQHHVWDNRKLAQKNINIIDPPMDKDKFTIDFTFGHHLRINDKIALLTVSRSKDIYGMEIFLDPNGTELTMERDKSKYPKREYLALQNNPKISMTEGITLTFPEDTDIVLGETKNDSGINYTKITLSSGTKIRITTEKQLEYSKGKIVPIYRDGRLLYRLPTDEIICLKVPLAKLGKIMMKLHIDISRSHRPITDGLIRLIQSDVNGRVVGGLDITISND